MQSNIYHWRNNFVVLSRLLTITILKYRLLIRVTYCLEEPKKHQKTLKKRTKKLREENWRRNHKRAIKQLAFDIEGRRKSGEDFALINGTNDRHSRLGANIWTLGKYTATGARPQTVPFVKYVKYTFDWFGYEYANLQTKHAPSWATHRAPHASDWIITQLITVWCLMLIWQKWWLLFLPQRQ